MAALGIPFSPVTATISALAIGIGVPFNIHVAVRFIEDRDRFDSPGDAIRSTTRFTGGALAGSAFTTMAGFGVLVFSSLVPFQQLGAVVAIAVGCSLVAAALVLPSMLILWDRWHRRRGETVGPVLEPGTPGAGEQLSGGSPDLASVSGRPHHDTVGDVDAGSAYGVHVTRDPTARQHEIPPEEQ